MVPDQESVHRTISNTDDEPLTPNTSRQYSTFNARSNNAPEESSGELRSPTGRGRNQTSRGSNQADNMESSFLSIEARQRTISPDQSGNMALGRPVRPSRRATSHHYAHRGAEYSVDDETSELDEDLAKGRITTGTKSQLAAMRQRNVSTLRRRNTGNVQTSLFSGSMDDRQDDRDRGIPIAQDFAEQEPPEPEDILEDTPEPEDGDADISDTESFTLKDRQEAINETHPFGIRIWKPAVYKKDRSVQKKAEGDIHSTPGGRVSRWLFLGNVMWILVFGVWLSAASLLGALICFLFGFTASAREYGKVLWGLAGYFIYPFGMFVRMDQDDAYIQEDEGEGRSISEYERWQTGDIEEGRLFFGPAEHRSIVGRRRNSVDTTSETDSLLGRGRHPPSETVEETSRKRRLFGRGEWNIGRVIFFLFFYGLIAPLLLLICLLNWMLVFTIPMAKVTGLIFYHLRRRPLALSFHSDSSYSRVPGLSSSVLLCTYRAVGWKYYKYTIDGTNIFFINLIGIVLFTFLDYWVLVGVLHLDTPITHPGVIFTLSLASTIPLAYFIGQAVASISAQSSMGLGAAINAFFSTVVEVYLYCVALKEGKGRLVEGSVIGSIMAGILLMPGFSMCFGAIVRKTQRFNAKSAGVTSTMLLFSVIAAFGPTLFYQIYGTYELQCRLCVLEELPLPHAPNTTCRRCSFQQVPALDDRFYHNAVKPFCYGAAVTLFLAYIIGLWFTLRTHAAVIWNTPETTKPKPSHNASVDYGASQSLPGAASIRRVGRQDTLQSAVTKDSIPSTDVRDTQMYKRVLGQSLNSVGLPQHAPVSNEPSDTKTPQTPHIVPPKSSGDDGHVIHIAGLSDEANNELTREVVELAATAATVAAQEASLQQRRRASAAPRLPPASQYGGDDQEPVELASVAGAGGHDAPNWSRTKSTIILLGATLCYAMIAEILVNTVDVVLTNVAIDEKFLGITLFALVPNTTEFLVSQPN
jgi:Ca2+:H+ antiporter